jgi:hypothetical protein
LAIIIFIILREGRSSKPAAIPVDQTPGSTPSPGPAPRTVGPDTSGWPGQNSGGQPQLKPKKKRPPRLIQ